MKLALYQGKDGPRSATVVNETLVDLAATDDRIPVCTKELLAAGPEMLRRAEEASRVGTPVPLDSVKLLSPIAVPQKLICIGANYAKHAREFGRDLPEEPIIFCKFPTSLRGSGDPIVLPKVSQQVDYEAELVVVIGREGYCIREEDAMDHVAGYTCGNDVSARDWQFSKPSSQWLLGKSFDSFAPVGPWIVTTDEIPDSGNLNICLHLNGQTMQQSNTRNFIFPLPMLIAYVSQVCTLMPGDLLFTGTPEGVGMGRTPPVFLKPGDTVEVEIEKIGTLKNPIVAG